MTRIVVLTTPRSGTHFVTRSIAKSLGIPYSVSPYAPDPWPSSTSWVVGTHEPRPDLEELGALGARAIIVERDPLDNVLSFFGHPFDADSRAFVDRVRESRFLANRRMHDGLALPRFSYEALASSDPGEWSRLSEIVGQRVEPEPFAETRAAEGATVAVYGQPGRWRTVLSPPTATALLALLSAPVMPKEAVKNDRDRRRILRP